MLSENGKAAASIVLCDGPTIAEQTVAKELAAYLGAVTGGTFAITPESQAPAGAGRIFVGPTAFAQGHGLGASAFGPEEWAIRTVGDDLVLVGGRPRGTLYAVYRFLEDVAGVHWWNAYEESVPRQPALRIESLDRKGRPAFRYRDIYMLYANDGGRFAARNRLNREGDGGISAEYGGEMGYGPPYHVHTFYMYVPPETYFSAHPEWFSLINGQRDASQKQLCLTNAELRSFVAEKLKTYIEQARAAAQEKGEPAPTVFDISQNDWGGMCECADCQAIAKAEESEAGPLLDFLNYMADAVKNDYPEVSLDTLAYMMTQKPPKTIKPRDNVIIRLCDTDSHFTKPITDPDNQKFREHLLSWAGIAKNLRIWDYAVTYAPYYGLPLPTVHTYAPDYRFYAEHNVEGVFTEHEYPILADMRDFKIWMMMKLLEDPYQDYDALVRTFTDGFYGAAGEHIRGYLGRLEKAAEAKPSHLSMGASPRQYRYLDLPFVLDAQGVFDEAEQAAAGDEVLLRRVRFARLPLDRACVVLFPDLLSQWVKSGHPPETVPLDRDAIAARYKDTWYTQIAFRIPASQQEAARAEADAELKPLLARPAFVRLPEKFRSLPASQVFDYTADVTRNWQDQAKRVPDPDAESGIANRLELSDDDMKKYALPMPWGLYDVINKRSGGGSVIKPEDVSGPGYHWYRMGTFPIRPSYYLYFFWSWVIQVDLENAVDPDHPEQPYEVWARVEFEGPGFPHGQAADKNAISVERVVLVKASEGSDSAAGEGKHVMTADALPMGTAPEPVDLRHFPDRLHAYVWRNWTLVPAERLAAVVGAKPEDLLEIGKSMGLSDPPQISEDQQRRSYITVVRRNWHLLPYEQLIELLGWNVEKMDYVLREGDGLFWWLGGYKPRVAPLRFSPPTESAKTRAAAIASVIREAFPGGVDKTEDPPFAFIQRLTQTDNASGAAVPAERQSNVFSPRFCYSYFGPFRAPLSDPDSIYPAGYLARLGAMGVNGVWLHEPLYRLAPFPWDATLSDGYQECIENLRRLVARAKQYGIGVYIYLNEPRPMPMAFFEKHPELKGVEDTGVLAGQVATLCTSVPEVQQYLREAVASVCRAVPDLAGIFTITASESYTNCWSHGSGDRCARCGPRGPEEVIAGVNACIAEGIAQSGGNARLLVWDWGWKAEWTEGIIRRLPASASLISVSEWDIPIERGGIANIVGEYSLSVMGPGPRATRNWGLARARGLTTIAKVQASTTWELGAVPYIPVVETAAKHAANLRDAGVNGLMLSWTLGGYPSPSFEAIMELGKPERPSVDEALSAVAQRRFGQAAAPAVVEAWKAFSAALSEYPFAVNVLYQSPVHMGPANLLWAEPTGYRGSVIMGFGFPLDDVDAWRGVYPTEVFAAQFERVASGFDQAIARLRANVGPEVSPELAEEMRVAEACAIHFRSVANQTRFVALRDRLPQVQTAGEALASLDEIEKIVREEEDLAIRLHAIQQRDSRIGFEAACQYFYIGVDLGEKVINCQDLLSRWLSEQRAKWGKA
jgi:hypothetical protein